MPCFCGCRIPALDEASDFRYCKGIFEKRRKGSMFSKFQDFLLVVVLFYSIYRIGFGEGVTTVNLFILLCAVVAVISMALRRSGAYDRAHVQREEAMKAKEKDKNEKEP